VRPSTHADVRVRPYRDEDEPDVVALLSATLGGGPGGGRSPEFFRWKHLENPFGRSLLLLGEADGRVVGLRAFMRWRFQAGSRAVRAVRAVDTATHPEYQGRGVFSRLTTVALDELVGQADLVFNTPNEKSLPGYLKLGWQAVGDVSVSVRVRRPVRFARGFRAAKSEMVGPRPTVKAEPAADILADGERVEALLAAARPEGDRLRTPRDLRYLRWRYGSAPLLDYRGIREERNGRLLGLALFRLGPRGKLWETRVSEVIFAPESPGTARRLLARVARAAAVDHLTCSFPGGTTAAGAARRAGFIRAPRGMTLVVNPLRQGLVPDPSDLRSWALSLGDLEVF
jgi:GNAT superfamily N-acetyltransferase